MIRRGAWSVGRGAKRLKAVSLLLPLLPTLYAPRPTYAFGKDNIGTSGAVFLKIAPGARPVGMGEAFTGLADDVHAIYWNPAGLGRLTHPELTGMHMQYFQAMNYEYAAFAYPTQGHGTWGVAVQNLHADDLQARTQDTDTPDGSFTSNDSAYTAAYAYPLTPKLSLGGNLKYVRQSLNGVVASAYAVDGGALYDTGWNDLRVGASLQNLGSRVKFQNESDPLPMTLRLGASAPLFVRNLLLSSDVILPRDNAAALALGGEYKDKLVDGIGYAVRSGYVTGRSADGLSGVSVGAGLTFGRAAFDFAWVPFGELGNTYRYALHLKFGPPEPAGDVQPNLQIKKASTKGDPMVEPSLEF